MTLPLALPDAPAVVAGHGRAALLTPDGEMLLLTEEQASARLRTLPPPLLDEAREALAGLES